MNSATNTPATARHFASWAKIAKGLDVASLLWVIDDCRQAAAAMKGWNPVREGYYRDEASTYGQELTRRQKL